jgi:hypothetical protein
MHKGQQFQLPMFMNAREVLDTMFLGDDDHIYPPTHPKGILPEKLAEAELETEDYRHPGKILANDIRSEGVKTPLSIRINPSGKRWLDNGHHRLAVMHDKDPEAYFPVTHSEDEREYDPLTRDAEQIAEAQAYIAATEGDGGIGSEWSE